MREALRCNRRHVPEEIELEHAFEAGEAGETLVGEGTIDQEMRGIGDGLMAARRDLAAVPACEKRKIMQKRQAGIGYELAAAEVTELRLPLQRFDRAVASWRSHQIH